jgi:hypothetical protein
LSKQELPKSFWEWDKLDLSRQSFFSLWRSQYGLLILVIICCRSTRFIKMTSWRASLLRIQFGRPWQNWAIRAQLFLQWWVCICRYPQYSVVPPDYCAFWAGIIFFC